MHVRIGPFLALLLPAAALAQESLRLSDGFDDNRSNWWLGQSEVAAATLSGGRLELAHLVAGSWTTWIDSRLHWDEAYSLEADLGILENTDGRGCGLLFGAQDGNNGHLFEVSEQGNFRLSRFEGGNWRDETGWQPHPAVRPGQGAWNTLRVETRGGLWHLKVNGQTVRQVSTRPPYGPKVGFFLEGRMRCAVERLQTWEPDPPGLSRSCVPDGPALPGETLLLNEEFVDVRHGWWVGDGERARADIRAGRMRLEHRQTGGWLTWMESALHDGLDYRVELVLSVQQAEASRGCGLWLGGQGGQNGHLFELSHDGLARISRFEGDAWIDDTGWRSAEGVRKGLGAKNILTLIRRAGRWSLFANGILAARIQARLFFGNHLGLRLENPMVCEIDSLRIYQGTFREEPRPLPAAPPAAVFGPAPLPPSPELQVRPRVIAVFEVEDGSKKLSSGDRSQLTEYLIARMAAKGGYAVVPRETLRSSLKEAKRDSFKECYDVQCQIELGKALAAEVILVVKILRVADDCAITGSLFDVRKEATAQAATLDTSCDMKGLLAAMRKLVEQL